jgi:heat-inducible transcriptional repressor
VRNDMAVLEDEGYLTQPHTSAGRIPTDKGYRLFVDRLATIKPLSAAERRAISTFLAGAVDLDDIVSRTVRLLAQITHQVAIVQYPISPAVRLRHVEVVSLSDTRVLVIVVTAAGRVEQRSVEAASHSEEVLARVRDQLNAIVRDHTPEEVVPGLSNWSNSLDAELRPLAKVVAGAVVEILTANPGRRVLVGGVPNLARFGDAYETTVKPVLEALEEQVVLLHLLGIAAGEHPGEVAVQIGQENPYEPLQATSVVAAAYGDPSDSWASLGVVGPTRMDYPSTIAAVRAVARYVGRYLAEG